MTELLKFRFPPENFTAALLVSSGVAYIYSVYAGYSAYWGPECSSLLLLVTYMLCTHIMAFATHDEMPEHG